MQWSSNSFGWHSVLEIIVADNRRARNTLNLISITFKSSISVYFWWFFIYYKEFLYYKLNINTIFMESNRSLNLLPPAGLLTIHLGTNYYNSFKSCIDYFHTSVLIGSVLICILIFLFVFCSTWPPCHQCRYTPPTFRLAWGRSSWSSLQDPPPCSAL